MQHPKTAALTSFLLSMTLCVGSSCSGGSEHREEHDGGRGEHDSEGSEHGGAHSEEGEEPGTELALDESYDVVRGGVRLVMSYDAASNSFSGTMENTTEATVERARVEVHLSNGKELGPTPSVDLAPGERHDVRLEASSQGFEGWRAHAEVGSGEHGGEGHD